jgi:hypothetical protein
MSERGGPVQRAVKKFRGASRLSQWLVGSIAGIVLFIAASCVALWLSVDSIIGKIYQNVVPPDGGEMAVTVTSYPSSANVVSVIGGKGEGLNCSISPIARLFFPRYVLGGRDTTVSNLFRQACVFHDLCYRHGLATYGYAQADCDQMLQEQAARICSNVDSGANWSERCQLNAKKVLAGVTFGGSDSYQSWRTSTYYEFDSAPSSSENASVARVIDNPFKNIDPAWSRNDPDQLLLTFEMSRSNTTVACRNCPSRAFSPAELRAAEIASAAPGQPADELIRPNLRQERAVGLPPRGIHSAPQLLADSAGRQSLVWLNRERPENTVTCVVIADPKHLLTHTRFRDARCLQVDHPRTRVGLADMFASSPQPGLIAIPQAAGLPVTGLVGTGLSLAAQLQICLSTNLWLGPPPGAVPRCYRLFSESGERIAPEFGAFQNFPIIKGERHIYLSRYAFNDPARKVVAGGGRALVFDVDRGIVPPTSVPDELKLVRGPSFDIPDDYDPMLPLSKGKDDLRLVSLKATDGKLGIYEIDLKSASPKPSKIAIRLGGNGAAAELHASWARRPVLVFEHPGQNGAPPRTELILSRSLVTTTEQTGSQIDSVQFEFMVLARSRTASELKQVRGLACKVTYMLKGGNPSRPCQRSALQVGDKRPSPAQMLQGAQLVAGRLTSPEQAEFDVALPDACYASDPVIVRPVAVDASGPAGLRPVPSLRVPRSTAARPLRQVECGPLADSAQIAQAMPEPQ